MSIIRLAVLVCVIIVWVLVRVRTGYDERRQGFAGHSAGGGVVWQMLQAIPEPQPPAETPKALHADQDVVLSVSEMLDLRRALAEGRFDAVEQTYTQLTGQAALDVAADDRLYDAIVAPFETPDPRPGAAADAWVAARPQSPHARLARASWRIIEAQNARGSELISRTPRAKIAAMDSLLGLATEDLAAALRQGAGIGSYWLALQVARLRGDQQGALLALQRALALSPLSFLSRSIALSGVLLPRWGGSYLLMDSIAYAASKYATDNPALELLAGYSVWDRADGFWRNKDSVAAELRLDSALAWGDNYLFCEDRGQFSVDYDRPEEALPFLECAIARRPTNVEPHYWYARAAWHIASQGGPGWPAHSARANRELHVAMEIDSGYRNLSRLTQRWDSMQAARSR